MTHDMKTIRAHSFHAVYHEAFDRSELFMGDLPCMVMSGEHGVEVMALEYMSSTEWHDAIAVWKMSNPEYAYTTIAEAIKYLRTLPVDKYGMAILPKELA